MTFPVAGFVVVKSSPLAVPGSVIVLSAAGLEDGAEIITELPPECFNFIELIQPL
jgi:hypothetical protein